MHIVSDHIRASDWNQQKIRYDWNYDSKYYKMSEGNLNTLSVAAARFVMKKKWMNRLFWIQKVQSVQMWFFLKMWFFWRNFLKFDFFLNRQLTLLPKKSRNRINKKPTEEKTTEKSCKNANYIRIKRKIKSNYGDCQWNLTRKWFKILKCNVEHTFWLFLYNQNCSDLCGYYRLKCLTKEYNFLRMHVQFSAQNVIEWHMIECVAGE